MTVTTEAVFLCEHVLCARPDSVHLTGILPNPHEHSCKIGLVAPFYGEENPGPVAKVCELGWCTSGKILLPAQ